MPRLLSWSAFQSPIVGSVWNESGFSVSDWFGTA